MSKIIICDRCKKEIKEEKAGYVALSWRNIASGDIEGKASDLEEWDFCMDCMAEIHDFVKMVPRPKVNPELVAKFRERNDPIPARWKHEEEQKAEESPWEEDEELCILPPEHELRDGDYVAENPPEEPVVEEPESDPVVKAIKTTAKKAKAGTHPKADLIRKMAKDGATVKEIMTAAGCSEPTAKKYMREVQHEQDAEEVES